jgi:hypothetical protein
MKLPLTTKDLKKYKKRVDNKMYSYGDTDLEKKVIRINKKKNKKKGSRGELLDSITHEITHVKHPHMLEKNVRKYTKKQVKRLGKKRKQKFYKLFQ